MPKEIIYPDNPPTADDPYPPFLPQVRWMKDTDVSLGLVIHGSPHIITRLLSGTPEGTVRNLTALGQSAANYLSGSPLPAADAHGLGCAIRDHLVDEHPEWNSLWWNPTRRELNRLIRVLRRAGAAAFGRDEW